MNWITYVIDGGITSRLFSPTRMPEDHENIKLNNACERKINFDNNKAWIKENNKDKMFK